MAVKAACDEIRGRIAAVVAPKLQAARARSLRGRHGARGRRGDALRGGGAEDLHGRVSLSATGFYKTPKIEWDRIAGRGRPFFYFAYGVA
jgi:xanthine dehydrogenase large subunit